MNYQQTIEYLYSRLPMFSRQGQAAIKPGLKNIIRFCEILNNPQQNFRSVHIAGTNGKGSTSHMLAAILQTAGYKTGLYTSPHLRDFRERIRVNGEMIGEQNVVNFIDANKASIEQIEPSFFETTVAMAFDHFAKEEIDIAVVEVGLGGRLDSTNLITPLVSVITNIGLDHVEILGKDLFSIGSEKAGIIKSGVPVVISQRQSEIENMFIQKAADMQSSIVFASDKWEIENEDSKIKNQNGDIDTTPLLVPEDLLGVTVTPKLSDFQMIQSSIKLQLDLTGNYQLKNLAGVLSAVQELRNQGFAIADEHIKTALMQVKTLTGLMGRWQTLSKNPLVICDSGHNEDGIREVIKNIAATPYKNLHMVIGMVKDKDISKILGLLPKNAKYYFCQPDIPRAKAVQELWAEATEAGLTGQAYSSVKSALEAAKESASSKDFVFIGGSTFVVAEIV